MIALASLLAVALAAETVADAPGIDRGAVPAPAVTDTSAASPATGRGKPRVSRVRCAMVTCDAPCPVAETRQVAAAAPGPAPCPVRGPVRRAES